MKQTKKIAGPQSHPEVHLDHDNQPTHLKDAKISGYTDQKGQAVSKTRKDKIGSPTGAYTDVGAGRSSAVHSKK